MLLKILRAGLGRIIIFGDFVTRKTPMVRDQSIQSAFDQKAKTMALYQFYACPFCLKVRRLICYLNITIELRDAQHHAKFRQELLDEGGKIQVPCLRVEQGDQVQWLYDSNQINDYLKDQFG